MKQLFLELRCKKKDFKSKCRSLKGTEIHAISHQKQHSRESLFSYEKEAKSSLASAYLKKKSIYLIKFSPTFENPDHIQNCFLSVPLPQTFCTFLEPDFISYSFHLEIISFRTNPPFFLVQNIFPFLIPSFLKTHIVSLSTQELSFTLVFYRLVEDISRWYQTSCKKSKEVHLGLFSH